MKRTLLLALGLALAPSLALAQGGAIFPTKPLDPVRLHARNTLLVLRDSLMSVNSAAARMQRDYRETSAIALTGHARRVADACTRAARNVPEARAAVLDAPLTSRAQQRVQVTLLRMLDSVAVETTHCGSEFGALAAPGKGEDVRGYANRRIEPVLALLVRYDRAATGFFKVYQIDVDPIGARPNPLAS